MANLAVWVPVLVAVVGGVFGYVYKKIDKKTEAAKTEVNKNTAEVEAVLRAMEGVERQAAQLRIDLDRREVENDRLHARIEVLEHDLIEEKSVNIALDRENARLRELAESPTGKEVSSDGQRALPPAEQDR